jgi:predicted RNA-binding Zn-ribbon protein involved in translation (DUF1610 family)
MVKVRVIENPNVRPINRKKGKLIGYCTGCDLMIADFDKLTVNYRCPRCGKLMNVLNKEAQPNSRSVSDIFAKACK